jgi:hypothetical protein
VRLYVNHLFKDVSLERFVATYFSEDFNNAAARVSNMKDRRLIEERIADDGSRQRRVRLEPAVPIPAALQRFVDETIRYDEVSSYDPATHTVHYHIDSKAKDRIKVEGTIVFRAEGDGVRRVIDGVIEVKAPLGLSGVVERFIEAETAKGYEKIAVFVQRWLDERR